MVYSTVCRWLEDYLRDEETELYDSWDFMEWIAESEIVEVFEAMVLQTLSHKDSKNDAQTIFYSLLWEYYLLRRDLYNSRIVADVEVCNRLKLVEGTVQHSVQWFQEKRNLVTASEFSSLLTGCTRLIKSKVVQRMSDSRSEQTVVVGRLSPMAWGHRYEPVIRSIYAKYVAKGEVFDECTRIRHRALDRLAATPDGLVLSGPRAGRLLEIKAPVSRDIEEEIIPEPYYIQVQVQMEVCDVAVADYCECRIRAGSTWQLPLGTDAAGVNTGMCIGAVAVVGSLEDPASWLYEYSPLYDNTAEGRILAEAWVPIGDLLEKQLWQVEKMQTITLRRNPRWWATVGLPAYTHFWKHVLAARNDPMFLAPGFLDDVAGAGLGDSPVPVGPMFVD